MKHTFTLLLLLPSLSFAAAPPLPSPTPSPPAVSAAPAKPLDPSPPAVKFSLPNGKATDSAEVFAVLVQQDQQIKALQKSLEDLQKRFNQLFDLFVAQQEKTAPAKP